MAKAKKKKVTSSKKRAAADKSFKIVRENTPFMSYRITDQTIYWAILFVYIFALSLWVLNIQIDTLKILESIQ